MWNYGQSTTIAWICCNEHLLETYESSTSLQAVCVTECERTCNSAKTTIKLRNDFVYCIIYEKYGQISALTLHTLKYIVSFKCISISLLYVCKYFVHWGSACVGTMIFLLLMEWKISKQKIRSTLWILLQNYQRQYWRQNIRSRASCVWVL